MPRPGTARTSRAGTNSKPRVGCGCNDGAAQAMFGMALQPGGQRQHFAGRDAVGLDRDDLRPPNVSVPVLSKAITRTRANSSSAPASRTRQPWRANRPMPSDVASGAARPTAHGQATTRTESPSAWRGRAAAIAPSRSRSGRRAASTPGTAAATARSAIRWIGLRRSQRIAHRPADLRPPRGGSAAAAADQQ